MDVTGSPEKIEKEKKTHHSAMKFVGVISFAALISTFTAVTIIATTSQAYAQENDRRAISETIDVSGDIVDTSFCDGEQIELSGEFHLVGRLVEDETGTHAVFHVNAQGVKGVGLTTGNNYRFVYADNTISFRFGNDVPETVTAILSGHLISQGSSESAPNLLVHGLFHATVNANGQITVFLDNFSAECR